MKLFQTPDLEVKSKVTGVLFGLPGSHRPTESFAEYFDFYEDELRLLRVGTTSSTWQAGHLAVEQHEDIIEVVELPRTHRDRPRTVVHDEVAKRFKQADANCISRSIDLAVRLWLMINVRDPQFKSLRPLSSCVEWRKDETLDVFVKSLFPKSRWIVSGKESRLDVHFTAVMMAEVCGLKLHWTTSLQDHLVLDRRKRILSVFAYKSVLESPDPENPIPPAVLKETAETLDLLFPIWDRRTEKLLINQNRKLYEYGSFPLKRKLNLMDFDHWRDRLLELYEEVYKAPPVTWSQLWRDRRNPHLFYTFWLAFAILVLAVGQFITGVIQAWASLQALRRDIV